MCLGGVVQEACPPRGTRKSLGGQAEYPPARSRRCEIPRPVPDIGKRRGSALLLSHRKCRTALVNEDQGGHSSDLRQRGLSPNQHAVTSPSPDRVIDIGGLVPLSTTDYPGGVPAAIIFLQGCPWRCAYCNNPSLQPRHLASTLPWSYVEHFLEKRRATLDAVVLSGGEPTLHAALGVLVNRVRDLGYKVGLHTAGIYPRRLAAVLPHLDWVGFDVKSRFDDYERVTGRSIGGEAADESLQLLIESGVEHEVRLTWHPRLFAPDALLEIANGLARRGVRNFALQEFRAAGCPNPELTAEAVQPLPTDVREALERLFPRFEVRRAQVVTCS
jgi:pyruvate formate lyase activating enzyme